MPIGLPPTLSKEKKSQIVNTLEQSYQILYSSWNRCTQNGWDKETLEHLVQESLEISSLAANNDLSEISDRAKELVMRLRWIFNKGRLDPDDDRLVLKIMDSIKTDISSLKPGNVITLHRSKKKESPAATHTAKIGLLEGDQQAALNIKFLLESANYAVEVFDDSAPIKEGMANHDYDLVIVDLLLPNCPLASASSVEEFLSHNPIDIPVIMLSEQADLSTRLIALRAGIKAYLTKPVEEEDLLGKIKNVLDKRNESQLRVLMVDDDDMLTEYYEAALEEEGFIIKTINNPIELLEAADSFKPDVITLDYLMPGCNGLEAAEILRGDPKYMQIPIVFMSGSEDAIHRKGLMGLFGNAFLQKPVDIDQLSDTLNEIAAKARKVKQHVEKVSKRLHDTHLENRDYFLRHLETSLEDRVYKENIDKNHYLMLASIDNIPLIKENYGSLALMKLEDKIETFFSQHALINGHGCKFGDHSCLLLVDDEKKIDSELLFKKFRELFKSPEFTSEPSLNYLSLSIGVTKLDGTCPTSMEETIQLVENANMSASSAGGDQLHWAAMHKHSNTPTDTVFEALKAQSFQLAFQSIVKPDGDEQIFEVLVRLIDEYGEIYTPEKFIPYLDEAMTDGSYHLDRWVIENAFRSLENTSGRGAAEFSIVIKLSPDLKQVERLMPFIYNIVSNTRLRGINRIYFSISEKAVLSDVPLANTLATALHTAGCGFMIEHCEATGRSLEAIKQIDNVEFVKLAPSLTSEKTNISKSRQRIEAMQEVMADKGQLIAGLVEDAKTFAHFWDMDIRYFQGFFIHRPNNNMNYQPFEAEQLVLEK